MRLHRRWILPLAAALIACAGVFLMVRAAEGQIAMDYLLAIERGDLAAAAEYLHPDSGQRPVAEGPAPDWAWHPERIVAVSPNDSAYAYDVTVEVSALVAGERLTGEVLVSVGETRRHGEGIAYPWMRSAIAVEGGPMAVAVAGTTLPPAEELGIDLLPGVYLVTGLRPDGVTTVRGFLPVPPPDWDEPGVVLRSY